MDMLFTRASLSREIRQFAESQAGYHGERAIELMLGAASAKDAMHHPAYVAFAMIAAAKAAGWARIALEAKTIALDF